MQNRDNLKGRRVGPVDNRVIGITRERPETQRTAGEVGACVAAHGSLGNKGASIVNRLFNLVSGLLAVIGDIRPNLKNIGFGERVRE
jgi:hypothetical protein